MTAAEKLEGLSLTNGWKVVKHLERDPIGSGGAFSQSYLVEMTAETGKVSRKRTGFLKAFDFSCAFADGVDTLKMLEHLTASYNHERDVLEHCQGRRLSNVALAIDHGQVQVPHMDRMEGRVYYLVFELADGDVRIQMSSSGAKDALWCMRALKDISLALWQIHKEMIAHQDTKPSNVLVYSDTSFRVADFGCSSRRGKTAPRDRLKIPGDRGYAPPELQYGFLDPDFIKRRVGCDLHMLGNLAAFLFSGTNITADLLTNLAADHHPTKWGGTYEDVLPYVQSAFSRVLADLKTRIDPMVRDEVVALVSELCNPDLARRGHPKGVGRHNQYSLERYVSRLDLAHKRLAIAVRAKKVAA